jgi:hypothetical protein
MPPPPGLSGMIFAFFYTMISALVIVLLGHLGQSDAVARESAAKTRARVAAQKAARLAQAMLSSGFAAAFLTLAARAVTVSVQMLWTYVATSSTSDGLTEEQRGSWLHERILVTWALLLTMGGSAATVQLLRWREQLTDDPEDDGEPRSPEHRPAFNPNPFSTGFFAAPQQHERPPSPDESVPSPEGEEEEEASAAAASMASMASMVPAPSAVSVVPTDGDAVYEKVGLAPEVEPPQQPGDRTPPHSFTRLQRQGYYRLSYVTNMPDIFDPVADDELAGQRRWRWLRAAMTRVLLLIERTFAYVTAWAWCDVLSVQSPRPSVWLVLKDSGVAVLLTCAIVAWLVFIGGSLEYRAGVDRHVVESYFIANSASFFVGWTWWKVLRDLAAVSGRAAILLGSRGIAHELPATPVPLGSLDDIMRDEAIVQEVELVQGVGATEYAGALLSNVFLGPVLSVVVILAKHKAFTNVIAQAEAESTLEQQTTLRKRLGMAEKAQQ